MLGLHYGVDTALHVSPVSKMTYNIQARAGQTGERATTPMWPILTAA